METGSKSLKIESNKISNDIIINKCNSSEMKHQLIICDFTGWIEKECLTHSDKNSIVSILNQNQFEICKRKEATNYVCLYKIGSDIQITSYWIRKMC